MVFREQLQSSMNSGCGRCPCFMSAGGTFWCKLVRQNGMLFYIYIPIQNHQSLRRYPICPSLSVISEGSGICQLISSGQRGAAWHVRFAPKSWEQFNVGCFKESGTDMDKRLELCPCLQGAWCIEGNDANVGLSGFVSMGGTSDMAFLMQFECGEWWLDQQPFCMTWESHGKNSSGSNCRGLEFCQSLAMLVTRTMASIWPPARLGALGPWGLGMMQTYSDCPGNFRRLSSPGRWQSFES